MQTAESTHHHIRLNRKDLKEIASGRQHTPIDDMVFLETLASNHCLVMPPYVYHLGANGEMEQVTPVRYDDQYNLNKAAILLAIIDRLPRLKCS